MLFILAGAILLPTSAYADAIWQSLFFEKPILIRTWWVIPAGLLIEYPVVNWILKQSRLKAAIATIVMNFVSFLIGMILQLPTLFLGVLSTVAMFAVAVAGNTLIEGVVLNRFRQGAFNRETWFPLFGVNVISVGLTMIVLFYYGMKY